MTDDNSPPELMKFEEVKAYWRVSTNTAKKYIRELGIIRHQLGTSQIYRYKREDIERALTSLESSRK